MRAWKGGCIWVFDYFKLVLLVAVEEAVEGCWGEEKRFGYQGGEGCRKGGHVRYVGFVGWAEFGEGDRVGPLVWGEEVVVEGRCRRGERVRR